MENKKDNYPGKIGQSRIIPKDKAKTASENSRFLEKQTLLTKIIIPKSKPMNIALMAPIANPIMPAKTGKYNLLVIISISEVITKRKAKLG
jgi:hypothetical protein